MTRRKFFGGAAAIAVAAGSGKAALSAPHALLQAGSKSPSTFCDVLRIPDRVEAFAETSNERMLMSRSGSRWGAAGIEVRTEVATEGLAVSVAAPSLPLTRIVLRWNFKINGSLVCMGDAWERSYGDLAWRIITPERVLPWYFATHDGTLTHGYGVKTGAASFCFWQIDLEGVSLWMDLSNGGGGVLLGDRELPAATVVSREGHAGELPVVAITALCRKMCPTPRLPDGPVYGTNDWYYAYGNNTAEGILRDTDLIVSLSPEGGARPFSLIDDGWQGNITVEEGAKGNSRFPNMARLAEQIRNRGARPGVWIRPIQAPLGTSQDLLLPRARFHASGASDDPNAYDPTIPEALAAVLAKVTQVVDWKYDLVKHDFSTYDLLGQWGSNMGAQPTAPGWHFHDRSRTNAEIVLAFYKAIRQAAGKHTMLLGCDTVGHLGAGLFELQRTGDDTSGRIWERTRRMGVNTLAYRLPQNGTFFIQDADCVGITRNIPWSLNSQWMDLLARSGTALFISPSPDAIGPEQKVAIAAALAIAQSGQWKGYPADWLQQTTPERWTFQKGKSTEASVTKRYRWCGETGCDPFHV